jgi:nucleoside-diphosphate-sugar epimerase
MSNLYGYGPVDGPLTEDLPLAATGPKGRTRARQWLDALEAHLAGRVRASEVRASDFFGPGVRQAMLGDKAVRRLLAGRAVPLLGDPDALHSVTYLPDVASFLTTVATDERAWGRAWHVPSPPPRTQRETVQALGRAAGIERVRVSTPPDAVLALVGLVVPAVRELRETRHQFERDWVLDASSAERTFGIAATPFEVAAERTIAALATATRRTEASAAA